MDSNLLIAAYLVLNVLSLLAYLRDKRAAERKRPRTSEARLLFLALLGPFGAYAGMRTFRHKTRKVKFLLVPLFMVAHLVIIYLLFLRPMLGT